MGAATAMEYKILYFQILEYRHQTSSGKAIYRLQLLFGRIGLRHQLHKLGKVHA